MKDIEKPHRETYGRIPAWIKGHNGRVWERAITLPAYAVLSCLVLRIDNTTNTTPRLSINRIGSILNLSRNTVSRAIKVLVAVGLVRVLPKSGGAPNFKVLFRPPNLELTRLTTPILRSIQLDPVEDPPQNMSIPHPKYGGGTPPKIWYTHPPQNMVGVPIPKYGGGLDGDAGSGSMDKLGDAPELGGAVETGGYEE